MNHDCSRRRLRLGTRRIQNIVMLFQYCSRPNVVVLLVRCRLNVYDYRLVALVGRCTRIQLARCAMDCYSIQSSMAVQYLISRQL